MAEGRQKKVVIYTTSTCPWCAKTKALLDSKGIVYTNYDVLQDRERAREMVEISGQRSVPVILIDGRMVIGYNPQRIEELLNTA